MSLLGAILDSGFNAPAACLIEAGTDRRDIGALAALVTLVDIQVSRSQAATGKIVIEDRRKEDGQWMAADSGLFSRWAPIRVSADFQSRVEEIIRGTMVQITPSYPNNGGGCTLEIEIQDDSSILDREQMRTVWGVGQPMTDKQILAALVEPVGLEVDPESADGQSSRSLAQDATPIQFLLSRAQANGYELIFQEGHVYFGPKRLSGTAQPPIMVYAGKATNCIAMTLTDEAQHPDAVRFDHAPRDGGAIPLTEIVTADEQPLGDAPAADEGSDVGTDSVWRVSREGDETEEEARARAQALVNEHAFRLHGAGELDGSLYGHVLKIAHTVFVDGAGARYGGTYYVERVDHVFSPQGYRQNFELIRNATGESTLPGGPLAAAASALSGLFGRGMSHG